MSFQAKKTLNIGKGGAILLNDYELYQKLNRLAWDGRDASIPVIQDTYHHGYHMNMIPDDAAKRNIIIKCFESK